MSRSRRDATAQAATGRTLTLRFSKKTDGTASLSCIRDDGTATWQKQRGASAHFFPRHDLTHYAVETLLGIRTGFYGMVSEGWDISDFGTPWPRGPMPEGADLAEVIVGMLDLERASGTTWPAADYRLKVTEYHAARGAAREIALDDGQLAAIRARRDELFAQLDATRPGDTLELLFALPPESE